MPKFKIHAIRTIAVDFEITAVDSEAAEAAIGYLLAMSPIIFAPIDPSMTPRYARGVERHWQLQINPKSTMH